MKGNQDKAGDLISNKSQVIVSPLCISDPLVLREFIGASLCVVSSYDFSE